MVVAFGSARSVLDTSVSHRALTQGDIDMKKVIAIVIAIVIVRMWWQVSNGYSVDATINAVVDGVNVICAHPAEDVYVCEPTSK